MRRMPVRRQRAICIMRMRSMGMLMVFIASVRMILVPMRFVRVSRLGWMTIFRNDVHFGCGQSAPAHLAHLQVRAHVQRCSSFLKGVKGNTRVDEGAKKHVAAYA